MRYMPDIYDRHYVNHVIYEMEKQFTSAPDVPPELEITPETQLQPKEPSRIRKVGRAILFLLGSMYGMPGQYFDASSYLGSVSPYERPLDNGHTDGSER